MLSWAWRCFHWAVALRGLYGGVPWATQDHAHPRSSWGVSSQGEGRCAGRSTHCGQIRLPLIGSPWIPSDAPNDATCGVYEDNDRLLWVSSGVGTSILPIRFGTQSQWNLLEMSAPSCPKKFCPGALNTWHQNELCIPELRMTTVK